MCWSGPPHKQSRGRCCLNNERRGAGPLVHCQEGVCHCRGKLREREGGEEREREREGRGEGECNESTQTPYAAPCTSPLKVASHCISLCFFLRPIPLSSPLSLSLSLSLSLFLSLSFSFSLSLSLFLSLVTLSSSGLAAPCFVSCSGEACF